MTRCGTCVPPGPSRNTTGRPSCSRASAGNCARARSTSIGMSRTVARLPWLESDVTYEDLLALARRFEGKTLETVTGKRFRVGVYMDCPFFTPESSGYGQSDGRAAAERFVARFNEIGSLRPTDYSRVTRNASYYVALLRNA